MCVFLDGMPFLPPGWIEQFYPQKNRWLETFIEAKMRSGASLVFQSCTEKRHKLGKNGTFFHPKFVVVLGAILRQAKLSKLHAWCICSLFSSSDFPRCLILMQPEFASDPKLCGIEKPDKPKTNFAFYQPAFALPLFFLDTSNPSNLFIKSLIFSHNL